MTPPLVKRYFIALDQYKFIPIATLVLGVGISSVVAMLPPPPVMYEATGSLAYSPPQTPFTTTGPQIQEQGRQLSEDMLLDSNLINDVAMQVKVDPKKLRQQTKVNFPKPTKGKDKDAAAGPQSIQVSYTDDNPNRAAFVVTDLMKGMVERSRSINSARLKAIIDSISKRLPDEKKKLQEAQNTLERYIHIEGPAILAAQDGSTLNGIIGAQQQQRQIQLTLGGLDAQINSLQRRLGLNPEQAYTSSALSADPIILSLRGQLQQIENQIKVEAQDLRPTHPTMVELNKRQQTFEKLLQERADEVMGGKGKIKVNALPAKIRADSSLDPIRQQMANQLVALQTQRETLQQQLVANHNNEQELRQEYTKLPSKQLEQTRLQQQVQIQQGFYSKMEATLMDAKAAEAETVSSFSMASQKPEVSRTEAEQKPKALLVLGAGGLVGLLTGAGLIFLLATLDTICYTPQEIKKLLQQRDVQVLGELPVVALEPGEDETLFLLDSDSPYLEFYERVRSQLHLKCSQPLKVLLITSAESEEGKTTSAYNLAIAAARAGKRTLLVEADLRSPTSAKSLKVAPDPEASMEPLRYYGQPSECIRLVPNVENLYIVPSPTPVRHVAAVLESNEFRRLLEDARVRFDFVVLDTPPLSKCNDALTLESYTDGMLLVTRPGFTQSNMLSVTADELTEDEELPLLGAIINGVDKIVPSPGDQEVLQKQLTQQEREEKLVPKSAVKL